MSAREIEVAQWPQFLDQFSREHRAWLVTVDRMPPGSPGDAEVVERPLGSVLPQPPAGRIARIEIRFQQASRTGESTYAATCRLVSARLGMLGVELGAGALAAVR